MPEQKKFVNSLEGFSNDFQFISNSQDVAPILEKDVPVPKEILDFLMIRSVFVRYENEEPVEIWGIQQEVPYLNQTAWKLL